MPVNITISLYTFRELLAQAERKDSPTHWHRAVNKARAWMQEGETDHNWWEYEYEHWTTVLEQVGFTDPKIEFSGFWSQGDGASFTAYVDLDKLVEFFSTDIPPADSPVPVPGPEEAYDFRGWLVKRLGGKVTDPAFRRILWIQNQMLDVGVVRSSHQYSHEHTCDFSAGLNDAGTWSPGKKNAWGGDTDRVWQSKTPRVRALFDRFCIAAEDLRTALCRQIYKDLQDEYEYLTDDEHLAEASENNGWLFDDCGRFHSTPEEPHERGTEQPEAGAAGPAPGD